MDINQPDHVFPVTVFLNNIPTVVTILVYKGANGELVFSTWFHGINVPPISLIKEDGIWKEAKSNTNTNRADIIGGKIDDANTYLGIY